MKRIALFAALLFAALAARAASVTWSGGAAGNWSVSSNWSGGAVPGPTDDATIGSAFVVAYGTNPALAVNSLTLASGGVLETFAGISAAGAVSLQSAGALIFATTAPFSVGSLTLAQGSSVTYIGAPIATGTVPPLRLQIAGTFTLAAGSTVTVRGHGYAGGGLTSAGSGPGGGGAGSGSMAGAGGGHAGAGGSGGGGAAGGGTYDGLPPADGGSGGGGSDTSLGAAGGGVLIVDASTAALNGLLEADGDAGISFSFRGSGGGAGGAVIVRAAAVTGAGTISARGGLGGTGAADGAGGGGGGFVWIRETSGFAVFHATLTILTNGGSPGAGTVIGGLGANGAAYMDPRHWTGLGPAPLASNAANWSSGIAPQGGEHLVFGASTTAAGCSWDVASILVGSMTVEAAFSSSVVLAAPMTMTGAFDMAGGTLTTGANFGLTISGSLAQTGGHLDLFGSTLAMTAATGSTSAAFFDARASSVTFGRVAAATITVTGLLESANPPSLPVTTSLFLGPTAVLRLDSSGPFSGAGSVDASSSALVVAFGGVSTQTWTPWPGRLGGLRVSNVNGGLTLNAPGGTTYTFLGGVAVDAGAAFRPGSARLNVGGDWRNDGTSSLSQSTIVFNASSGRQTIWSGAGFNDLVVNNTGATLSVSTAVVVADTVTVLSGTLDLAASTWNVRGSWFESAGASVLGGRSIEVFDGASPQVITQLGGNSFGTFHSSSTGGVSISTTLATTGALDWDRGSLAFPGASVVVGGDILSRGGSGLTISGSTVVLAGVSTQTITMFPFDNLVIGNTSAAGARMGASLVTSTFKISPGAVFDGSTFSLSVIGTVWDTASSTYYATASHSVGWSPAGSITIGAGSVVGGQVVLTSAKTAVLLGDLTVTGPGASLAPQQASIIVNAAGGSTITFQGSADLKPSGGSNWSYLGDVADSWLVFTGSGAGRGSLIPTNTFGSVRVSLNTSSDTFTPSSVNLLGSLVVQGGTARPKFGAIWTVGGSVLQSGGLVDFGSVSTGTLVMNGGSSAALRMLSGAHSLWHVTDASTSTVQLASDLTVLGDFVVSTGTFAAGSGQLFLHGLAEVSPGASFLGQASTVTLNGASLGVPSQSLAFYGGGSFNGLAVNVQTLSLLASATAAVFSDPFAGGTLSVATSAQLTVGDLRLGPSGGSNLAVQSSVLGTPWYLKVTGISSATAVTVSDSNASLGQQVQADDGRSLDLGRNVNWNFNPVLLVLMPGETYTPAIPPGKTGTPQTSVAGVPVAVQVVAVSTRYDRVLAATGTVTLASDDVYATFGPAQALSSGAATLIFTPRTAEPSPLSTHVTAAAFFASGVSTTPVIPAGLARLQILLPGEGIVPGSPTGKAGAPFPRVKGFPFSATVRAVDSFWNVVTTVTDSLAMSATASSATLPSPPALVAGQVVASGLVIGATGQFMLSVVDVTEPSVSSATSASFPVTLPSLSSPTAAFYVPTGASIATLGGAVAGTAADGSSVARVRVDVREVESGLHFDWVALSFSAALPLFSTTTLAAPLSAGTSWSNPIPDAALANGRHYAATAIVEDPTGFVGVAASTFAVDRTSLFLGVRDGLGTATVTPASAAGCDLFVGSITFTAGSAGVSPGGAVAVRLPNGWAAPIGVSTQSPPPAGFWNVSSTSLAGALGSTFTVVNPASFGSQTLGPGWLVLGVSSGAPSGFRPGEQIGFGFAAMPALSAAGRGAQTFSVWSQGDGSGALAPVSTQPATALTSGATSFLAFTDPTPLVLGPLQASPTVQLKVVDACGNDKLGVSSGTAKLSLVVPSAGGYVTDLSARFFTLSGSTISSVDLTTGTPLSAGFVLTTSTSGPTLAYLQAVGTFTAVATSSFTTVAVRAVSLAGTAGAFSNISADTGTLTPGATSVALSPLDPSAYSARLVFTLSDPTLAWDAALSLDGVGFSTPAFLAVGSGDPSRPIVLSWDGVDRVSSIPARFAPPGHYHARLRTAGGAAIDTSLEVVVPPTAGYAGRLGAAGSGAFVRALGPGAGEGAFTQASSTGYFALAGVRAGQAYQIVASTATSAFGLPVVLSTAIMAPAAALPLIDLGGVPLPSPARLRVAAILPLPAPLDATGGFIGRAADGSAAFSGALHFSSNAATSDDAGPLFGRAASTWSAVLGSPGFYTVDLQVPDLRLSTSITSVALGASGLDLIVPFDRRAGASGYVVLPSTIAGGVAVSVQARRVGDAGPSAFASVFVTSAPPAVGSSSGAYALFGLSPGTWTVLASAPGFVSASTTIVVAGAADVTGLSLALGSGGSISGTLTMAGDSSALGLFDATVEALAVGTLNAASTRVRLVGSTQTVSGAFSLPGLAPGLWTVRASVPGDSLRPAGGVVVAVAGATISTASLTLAPVDARLRVSVLLPPPGSGCRPASSWSSLGLAFDGADGVTRTLADATASLSGSFATIYCSSANFFSPPLPPGAARVSALYAPSGAWAFARASLIDGTTTALTLDLRASSVSVRGLLSVSGTIPLTTATATGVPYSVAVSSPAGVLSVASGVSFCLLGSRDPLSLSALRVELLPYDPVIGAPPALRRSSGGAGACASPLVSSAPATSMGLATTPNPDGSFSFYPGVMPGLYLLRVPGELDGNPADGPEAVEYDQLVAVGPGGASLSPALVRGRRVTGALSAPSSVPLGRLFHVALIASDGSEARGVDVSPPPGGSVAFSFDGVPDGRYIATTVDRASVRAFAAPSANVVVAGADATGVSLALAPSAMIRARLAVARPLPDGTQESVLVTPDNVGLLGGAFSAVASADPAVPGGVTAARPSSNGGPLDALGRVTLDGLAPGTYDVSFAAPPLSPARVAGVTVAAGQVVDLGVVPLFTGSFVYGRVTDAVTGAAIAGLSVSARPSVSAGAVPGSSAADLSTVSDSSGTYLLRGLDPAARWYDVTAAPRGRMLSGAALPPYAARRALKVDVSSGAALDFALSPAAATITGRVSAYGGAALTSSLGPGDAAGMGAAVYLQTAGASPSEDPLADLAVRTNPDGSFVIPAVATGSYRLTAAALGQGGAVRAVVVTTATVDVGTIALSSGGALSGALRLPDGTAPSATEVQSIAAVSPDSVEFLYASLATDPSGRFVVGYSLGGLTPGRTYRLLVSGPGGTAYMPPEASALSVSGPADVRVLDLTLRPVAGPVAFRAQRVGTRWTLAAQFPRPLRAALVSDSDPTLLLTTAAAAGALSGGALSQDRQSVTAYYDPAPGETAAVFRASATLAATDWSATSPASNQLTAGATSTVLLLGDGVSRTTLVNGIGGTLAFDGDAGRVVLPRGAFSVDAATSVTVAFARSAAAAAFAAAAPPAALASAFYDVSLGGGGAPSSLARPAELTLVYSTSVADASKLHLYWYNPVAGTYVLQPDVLGGAPVIDGTARTFTVRINHFSTYVLLDASVGSIGGSAYGGGDIEAFNFPNPFDLSVKTITTIHGGGTPSIRGTMIRVSVPPGLSGAGTFRVFDVTGRLIRSMDLGFLAAGQTYYQGWDGRNDAGWDVAGGLYLGQVEVGGKRKTFKMAVLK